MLDSAVNSYVVFTSYFSNAFTENLWVILHKGFSGDGYGEMDSACVVKSRESKKVNNVNTIVKEFHVFRMVFSIKDM